MSTKDIGKKLIGIFLFAIIMMLIPYSSENFALKPVTVTAEAASKTVSLNKKSATLAISGKTTVQLKNVSPKKKLTWISSDKRVAAVKKGAGGKATIIGKRIGSAAITAKYGSKTYSVKVVVKGPALNKKTLRITAKKTGTITLNYTISGKKVTWKSSNTSVATVKSSGSKVTVTGKKAGTSTIMATHNGKKYTCKVTVKAAPKKLKIAVAKDTTGNTGSIVSMLNRCDNVEYKIISSSSCNVNNYDGLILPGGVDINPSLYGQKNTASVGINNQLDKLQYNLLNKFVKARKPVLGICRGLQLINVYFGGTLKQNIKKHRGVTHATTTVSGSWINQIFGKNVRVNSWHHQAINKLGKNLKITQVATKDNVVEAIEHETPPVYGVQYHPEIMSNGKVLFNSFLKVCRQYANTNL